MKCKLSEKCKFGNLCKDATRHDSLTVLGCSSFKAKEPMTNEEWLRQKSVEELAVFLAMVQLDEYEKPIDSAYVNTWVLWLKEKHEPLNNDEK